MEGDFLLDGCNWSLLAEGDATDDLTVSVKTANFLADGRFFSERGDLVTQDLGDLGTEQRGDPTGSICNTFGLIELAGFLEDPDGVLGWFVGVWFLGGGRGGDTGW